MYVHVLIISFIFYLKLTFQKNCTYNKHGLDYLYSCKSQMTNGQANFINTGLSYYIKELAVEVDMDNWAQ